MTKLPLILALLIALVPSGGAFGAVIELTPSSQIAATGDQVSFDLLATGLGAGASPAVGSFDVDVLYDPSVLGFASYTIGNALGLAFDFSFGGSTPGTVDLAASSLESAADLVAAQAASVMLASLMFDVLDLSLGASTTVQIDANDPLLSLGDENGTRIPVDDLTSATIRNRPVSAPGTSLLAVLGLAMLGLLVRTHQDARG